MLESDIKVRSAATDDAAEIKQLLQTVTGVWQSWWREDAVSIALESAGDTALVAVENGKIIGFACFHDTGFRAYLSEMVVAESKQMRGVGALLLKYAEQIFVKAGCRLIVADVYPPAEPFYRKNGWDTPSAVLMSKVVEDQADFRC